MTRMPPDLVGLLVTAAVAKPIGYCRSYRINGSSCAWQHVAIKQLIEYSKISNELLIFDPVLS